MGNFTQLKVLEGITFANLKILTMRFISIPFLLFKRFLSVLITPCGCEVSGFYLLTVGTCLIPCVGYSWLCSATYEKEMSSRKKGLFANRNEREQTRERNKKLLITKYISSAHISLTKAKHARSYISRKENYKSFHRKKQWVEVLHNNIVYHMALQYLHQIFILHIYHSCKMGKIKYVTSLILQSVK